MATITSTLAARRILRAAKRALSGRDFYGYGFAALMNDGDSLCEKCLRSEWRSILDSTINGRRDGWMLETIYSTDGERCESCAHCNERIAAAFCDGSGNPETGDGCIFAHDECD
jgi:hypothetical protein